jgi:VWFA-related protein
MARVALLWAALMSWLVAPLCAVAQQPGDSVPTIRSRTELILVPVRVTRSGQHARGLNQSVFHVFDNGQERPIAGFEEVARKQAPQPLEKTQEKVPTQWRTNQPQWVGESSLMVVVFDAVNTSLRYPDSLFQRAYLLNARQEFVRFMDSNPPLTGKTMVAVLGAGGLHVIHHYSDDPQSLKHDLEKLPFPPHLREEDELPQFSARIPPDIERAELFASIARIRFYSLGTTAAAVGRDATAAAFQQLANSLAAIPGRKTMIWITSGLPIVNPNRYLPMWVDERLEKARQALAAANVVVYPISINPGVDNPVWTSPAEATSSVPEHPSLKQPLGPLGSAMDLLAFAEKTGGRVCIYDTRLDRCFKKALNDSVEYYLLGYYVAAPRKPGWHKIRVKVDVPGVRVRARQGYMQPEPTQDLPLDQINLALASPLDFTSIPFSLRWSTATTGSGEPVNAAIKGVDSPNAAAGATSASGTSRTATCEILLDPRSLTMVASEFNHMKFDVILLVLGNDNGERAAKVVQTIDLHPRPGSLAKMLENGILYRKQLNLPPGRYVARAAVRDWFDGRIGTLTVPLNIE